MADFDEAFQKINEIYKKATDSQNGDHYANLSYIFRDLEGQLREYIQQITKDDVTKIIKNLKSGKELTTVELDYIKLWLVGDADYYIKTENNFNDWLTEVERLVGAINELHAQGLDLTKVSQLRSMLVDGARVLGDIAYFLEQKDRLEKFEEATKELDEEERSLLINLLEKKMVSRDY